MHIHAWLPVQQHHADALIFSLWDPAAVILMLYMDNKQARMTWNLPVLFRFCCAVDALP